MKLRFDNDELVGRSGLHALKLNSKSLCILFFDYLCAKGKKKRGPADSDNPNEIPAYLRGCMLPPFLG